jgi:hypothetical protein
LAQDEILGLKPRSLRKSPPDCNQQLGQKRDHRPLHYHKPSVFSSAGVLSMIPSSAELMRLARAAPEPIR